MELYQNRVTMTTNALAPLIKMITRKRNDLINDDDEDKVNYHHHHYPIKIKDEKKANPIIIIII